ncbi:MAG: AAA family ATPase, partial [Halofilum sp. (in: g-proteobacteria)]
IDVVYLVDPGLGAEEIVPAVAFELGLQPNAADPMSTRQRLYETLVERHAAGRQVVVFIEEAQNMPLATLEALRLLTNLETDDSKLLQLVLFGQPELDDKLNANEIRQLRERITHAFELQPLVQRDVGEYLNFRLRAVGYRGPDLFDRRVARALNRRARGLIRRLNLLADKTLLAAYAEGTHNLRRRHVYRAARDAGLARRSRFGRIAATAACLGLVAWMLLAIMGYGGIEPERLWQRGAGVVGLAVEETGS